MQNTYLVRVNNIRVALNNNNPLEVVVGKKLGLYPKEIKALKVLRKTIDARKKTNIVLVYHCVLELNDNIDLKRLQDNYKEVTIYEPYVKPEFVMGQEKLQHRPIVVGAGPAGFIAALELAKQGYKPLLLERGAKVEDRVADVEAFWREGKLSPNSNVQFGAGGAGTFSDGKLTTGIKDPIVTYILETFVAAGAPSEIMYEHKPHIGTDKLRGMVSNILAEITKLGGEIRYHSCLTDVKIVEGKLEAIVVNGDEVIPTQALILAIGHSARDTYQLLHERGVAMEAKSFAVGVRVEHSQELIDTAQYGAMAGHPKLQAADYSLVYHNKTTGRTAYSFCMCPGGEIVPAASEEGGVVTNGMSPYLRDTGLANSALLVNVTPEDYGTDVLAGIEFQRKYEQLAYVAGGASYQAPAQNISSFLENKAPSLQVGFTPSYARGLVAYELKSLLPKYVSATLMEGIKYFGRRIQGFDGDGMLVGLETRSSSPVRLVRGDNGMSINVANLYPTGEGAGYAGGITSAAADGYHQAVKIMERFRP